MSATVLVSFATEAEADEALSILVWEQFNFNLIYRNIRWVNYNGNARTLEVILTDTTEPKIRALHEKLRPQQIVINGIDKTPPSE